MDLPKHSFRTGLKLEMVSPWEQLQICPVSVTKVSRTGTMFYLKEERAGSALKRSPAALINLALDLEHVFAKNAASCLRFLDSDQWEFLSHTCLTYGFFSFCSIPDFK